MYDLSFSIFNPLKIDEVKMTNLYVCRNAILGVMLKKLKAIMGGIKEWEELPNEPRQAQRPSPMQEETSSGNEWLFDNGLFTLHSLPPNF